MVVEINGEKYRLKPKPQKKALDPTWAAIMAMGSLYLYPGESRVKNDPLEGVDIVKEYGLIQLKKSGLSRRLREMVVYRFEKDFEKVSDD